MVTEHGPLQQFQTKLQEFATGSRRAIRNPFVILPVRPEIEWATFEKMRNWMPEGNANIDTFNLQDLMQKTQAVELTSAYLQDAPSTELNPQEIEDNLTYSLPEEIAIQIRDERIETDTRQQILLLGNLGSLYPFTSASEILDQLERLNIKSTVGIIFPGPTTLSGSAVSFFGQKHTHYYPAHIIPNQLKQIPENFS